MDVSSAWSRPRRWRRWKCLPSAWWNQPFKEAMPMAKPIPSEIFPENLLEHRAVKAWQQLSPEWPLPVSVEVLQLQRKSATYRLACAASDRPTFTAKRCVAAAAQVERIIYEDFI